MLSSRKCNASPYDGQRLPRLRIWMIFKNDLIGKPFFKENNSASKGYRARSGKKYSLRLKPPQGGTARMISILKGFTGFCKYTQGSYLLVAPFGTMDKCIPTEQESSDNLYNYNLEHYRNHDSALTIRPSLK